MKTANALVQTELVEEPRVQVPDDSVLDDLQEEPKILEADGKWVWVKIKPLGDRRF